MSRPISELDVFLLDLDGVVYVGDAPLPGAVDALRRLRDRGKTLRFLTNDPRPTRRDVVERLAAIDVEAREREVVTCGWVTARYLATSGLGSAYVVGSEGLAAEIAAAGVSVSAEERPDAVVVGCSEEVGYPHIRRAARWIRDGARFVATNEDPTFPTPRGPAPATGTIVAAVRTASEEEPLVLGKPAPEMYRAALDGVNGAPVMVGDSLRTDIAGARELGIPAVWVADRADAEVAGETPEGAVAPPDEGPVVPDATVASLAALLEPGFTLP